MNDQERKDSFQKSNLVRVGTDCHGCPICCETDDDSQCCDQNLFLTPEQQDEALQQIQAVMEE